MNVKYSSFDNGHFCIDIDHARRFGDVASALMITQFKQDDGWVFCRGFPDGVGVSRRLEELLPIGNYDAMTILFAAFKPDKPIPERDKLDSIDNLIAKAKSMDNEFWVGDNASRGDLCHED